MKPVDTAQSRRECVPTDALWNGIPVAFPESNGSRLPVSGRSEAY